MKLLESLFTGCRCALLASVCCAATAQTRDATVAKGAPLPPASASPSRLAPQLQVGDLVFIRVPAKPFREVATATGSWTNHVGIVTAVGGEQPQISESALPFSRRTTLERFMARSENGRLAVMRLQTPLSPGQQQAVATAAAQRMGVLYDTGFDLHSSKRQFCSRFVREVLQQATGTQVGDVQTFAGMLAQRPGTDLGFWKLWYFGHIPWQRETVTPASVLRSPSLRVVFDGNVRAEL
jgi:hypothetical protein